LPYWDLEFRPMTGLKEADALDELDRLMRRSIRNIDIGCTLGILLSGEWIRARLFITRCGIRQTIEDSRSLSRSSL